MQKQVPAAMLSLMLHIIKWMPATLNYVHSLAGVMQDSLITKHGLPRPNVPSLANLALQVYRENQCPNAFPELNMQFINISQPVVSGETKSDAAPKTYSPKQLDDMHLLHVHTGNTIGKLRMLRHC